jgi:hypothetical protein
MNSPKRQNSVNLGAGDIKYYDFNGDGIIDGNDQHRIGKNSYYSSCIELLKTKSIFF